MEWSPASCDVNVKRLSLGPLVFTTVCDVAISWSRRLNGLGKWSDCFEDTAHLHFHYYAKTRVFNVFLISLLPLQRTIMACPKLPLSIPWGEGWRMVDSPSSTVSVGSSSMKHRFSFASR